MVVKNIQIHGVVNMDLQVKKYKVDISTTPRQNSLSPVLIITQRQRQITHSPS